MICFMKPSAHSRIRRLHFCGGEKSNNPLSNAYNPTIFPQIYKKKQTTNSKRTERLLERRNKGNNTTKRSSIDTSRGTNEIRADSDEMTVEEMPETQEMAIQTDPIFAEDELTTYPSSSTLYCWQDSARHEVSTQTCIVVGTKCKEKIVIPLPKKCRTIRVGPDIPSRTGFLGFEDIKDDRTMKQLGGITLSFFYILLPFIQPKQDGQPAYFRTLDAPNRLLLFLMKMKLGLSFGAIGCFFKVSRTSASTIFHDVLETLYEYTKTWIFWPSKEAIKETMPPAFKNYPQCRAIIDCTELHCNTPPTLEQRIQMYSSYKSGFTVKFLIGISPSGMITFISKGYGGRSTDGFIVNHSGFIELVEPGDLIMADKGFPQIKTALLERQCVLVMPPFATNPQFSAEEVREGYSIASVRIHVERAIQRVKIFGILRHIPIELLNYIDKVMYMACVLANNKEPLIRLDGLDDEVSE